MPTRRSFIQQTTAAAASAWAIPWAAPAFANASANDRPGFAQIGLGGMGRGDAGGHASFADLRALCDVDASRMRYTQNNPKDALTAEMLQRADLESDYRKLLDRSDIDIISISTVDHWHVKIAIEAMAAGKHVFCQKPLTLTVEEGELIAAAKRRYPNSVFQVGTQQRSGNQFLRAVNLVQQGLLGEPKKLTVGIDGSVTGGPFPVVDVPADFDWERWQGQTQSVPYRKQRAHYQFRWWYEYSGGKFTDWGAHHIDIALWGLNRNTPDLPAEKRLVRIDGRDAKHPVEFVDGYPTVDDHYNTSHDFNVVCHFADGVEMAVTSRSDNGILFEGDQGRIFVNRKKLVGKPIEENWDEGRFGDEQLQQLFKGKPREWHKQNFYRCLSEGGEPVSDTESHVAAMDVCHLVGIAARLGRELEWDAETRTFPNDPQATAMLSREQRAGYEIPRV